MIPWEAILYEGFPHYTPGWPTVRLKATQMPAGRTIGATLSVSACSCRFSYKRGNLLQAQCFWQFCWGQHNGRTSAGETEQTWCNDNIKDNTSWNCFRRKCKKHNRRKGIRCVMGPATQGVLLFPRFIGFAIETASPRCIDASKIKVTILAGCGRNKRATLLSVERCRN